MTKLSTEFALKNLEDLHFFLGVEAQTTSQGMHLTQAKYTREVVLQKTGMVNTSSIALPMSTSMSRTPKDTELVNPLNYRSLVGSLQYLTLT